MRLRSWAAVFLTCACMLAPQGLRTGLAAPAAANRNEIVQVSGIYPHLAMFNNEGECGTGAVVPWAGRLWVVTYAPHKPEGSSDRLYEVTPELRQVIRPESIGGTPANRLVHQESAQLFIGPYVIDETGRMRVIPYQVMYGRHTGVARHLTDPENRVVFATMEEGVYEVDVHTLTVKELWADEQRPQGRKANLPGYHGKGFYSGQGRYVYANNGDHSAAALTNPAAPSGALAEWDGQADAWNVVRRNQFTEVTGPEGISPGSWTNGPIWSIGWDHRSLILMVLDNGRWHSFRLPKASHCYDGGHGWNTEWPRIRDIGEDDLLMTMHGEFWRFPKTLSANHSAGLAPRSTYLKVIGDFCRWNDRIVFGCDDTAQSEFLNKHRLKGKLAGPGRSQSNLWFVEPDRLDSFGPPLGRGAVWLSEDVVAGVASEPFLFSGFDWRSLHLAHASPEAVSFRVEVDARGDGRWRHLRDLTVPAHGHAWLAFSRSDKGAWIRLVPNRNVKGATAFFHFRAKDTRGSTALSIFDGLARPGDVSVHGGLLHARGGEARTLSVVTAGQGGQTRCYELDAMLRLSRVEDSERSTWVSANAGIQAPLMEADAASVLYVDEKGGRWRLPKGDAAFDERGPLGHARLCREVTTERNLLNVHGTFYELPAENAGGFIKLRPITTHNRRIHDFASYRGLLVMTGIADNSKRNRHVVRSDDGQATVWVGAVDDLWGLGKPRGRGGPWMKTAVQAGSPSDPYLATGYDEKRLTLSHESSHPIAFKVEADYAGNATWTEVITLSVNPGKSRRYRFPDAFGAYWLRVTASDNAVATAQFQYD